MEYILILALATTLFVIVSRELKPILTRVAKRQAEQIEKRFGQGLYQFRFPSR